MKKTIIAALLSALVVMPSMAQNFRDSRYYNPQTDRLDYGGYNGGHSRSYWGNGSSYVGFRVGPSFSSVHSDATYLDGGSVKTGLNLGLAAGFAVSRQAPLYVETGLYYTEKGGKGKDSGQKFTYNLDYLEVPLVLKYKYNVDNHFSVQPYLGAYVACGVGGKIKDFGEREAYSSFSDSYNSFQRFDGGLKMGVGAQYDMFYVELNYDLGLSNIGHDDFDETKNSAVMLNFGLNF